MQQNDRIQGEQGQNYYYYFFTSPINSCMVSNILCSFCLQNGREPLKSGMNIN